MTSRRSLLLGLSSLLPLSVGLSACEDTAMTVDETKILEALGGQMLSNFGELRTSGAGLREALTALTEDVALENLEAARGAWRAVQIAWHRVRPFSFGPIKAIDPNIRWSLGCEPAKVEESILEGAPFDASTLGTSRKGLAAIEYLLFPEDHNDETLLVGLESDDRRAYLASLGADLELQINAASDAAEALAGELTSAGTGSELYGSPKDAVDALYNQWLYGLDLAIQYLALPLGLKSGTPDPSIEEARLSDQTKDDILAMVDGVVGVFRGPEGEDLGFAALLRDRSEALHSELDKAFDACREAVASIEPTVSEMLALEPAKLAEIVEALRIPKRLIAADVATALGVTISFSDMDGD